MGKLNLLSEQEFVAHLGGVFEHSPWIAEIAARQRPFENLEKLHEALAAVVAQAGAEKQLALINSHPDLAGRLAKQGLLTSESAREQAAAGLDLADAESAQKIESLNTAYRARFGFPFIICARLNNVETILAAMEQRLNHSKNQEIAAALAEISKIARLRLVDLVED